MNGYDIDGVLSAGVIPKEPYIVISGRSYQRWEETTKLIGTGAPIYLSPFASTTHNSARWKSDMINYFEVDTFYEDEEKQADIIKINCPNCKVILIK